MQGWQYGKGLIDLRLTFSILEILASNKSALCRNASFAFSFVLIPTQGSSQEMKVSVTIAAFLTPLFS